MRLIAILSALLLSALPTSAETVSLGDRFYRIDLPASAKGAPLLLVLHGGGGNPDQIALSSGISRDARARGYAVIFPAGTGKRLLTWNAGYCCGPAARRGADDLGFLAQVIGDARKRFGLGPHVYITGMSNGSMMAETFAARNPGLVQAVAGVSGTMDSESFGVLGQVPVLIIHGTADPMVPYEGGQGQSSLTRTSFASVGSVVTAFLAPWGAGLTESSRRIDRKADDTAVTITDHAQGAKIVLRLITIDGGGHNWPGGSMPRAETVMTREIDANTQILEFFALYP